MPQQFLSARFKTQYDKTPRNIAETHFFMRKAVATRLQLHFKPQLRIPNASSILMVRNE